MNIPFVDLAEQQRRIRTNLDYRIGQVLDHGAYIHGPEVAELETKLAEFASCRHAIGVSSGTDALLAALMAKGIGAGDAVFLPSFTFTATAEVVLLCGATPVFVDVDAATFNLDPDCLAEAIGQTTISSIVNGHLSSLLGEGNGDRLTNAARGSRYQSHLVLQFQPVWCH